MTLQQEYVICQLYFQRLDLIHCRHITKPLSCSINITFSLVL